MPRSLNPESVRSLQEQSNEEWFNIRLRQNSAAKVGIAEGDSCFDFPPAWLSDVSLGELINQLNQRDSLNIL